MGRTHELKTWPEFFAAVASGAKTFEVRPDDRGGFAAGDVLRLNEWDPESGLETGRSLSAEVSYVLTGGMFGIEPGFVVMGIKQVEPRALAEAR